MRSRNHGSSRVPVGVHGPQRAIRLSAFQPPRMTPSRVIAISAYRLQDGVKRQRMPDPLRDRRQRVLVAVDGSHSATRLRVQTTITHATTTGQRL